MSGAGANTARFAIGQRSHQNPYDPDDAATSPKTIILAQATWVQNGRAAEIKEIVEDNGYHQNEHLAWEVVRE